MWRMISSSRGLLVRPSRCMSTMSSSSISVSRSSQSNGGDWNKDGWMYSMTATAATMSMLAAGMSIVNQEERRTKLEEEEEELIVNWSGTHSVHVKSLYEPKTVEELEEIVAKCHKQKQKLRPVGSALSPNALSFQQEGMIRLDNLDQILHVDTKKQTVTVQAGARISQVIEALRPYHLTLPNLASIAEQQMGGFVQVGAHGTGAAISSIDHYIESITLITPASGKITLTKHDGEEFQLAKVGLGALGVVSEITLQCVPSHSLKETTICMTRQQAKQQLSHLLQNHQHVRYMWIPYTDTVVVVINDPTTSTETDNTENHTHTTMDLTPLKQLIQQLSPKDNPIDTEGMGFGDLRDILLAINPLDTKHVQSVNQAEATFWNNHSNSTQVKPSDQLLQFDCGGQQWVLEVCFPTGTYDQNNGNDLNFMDELLNHIESQNLPAPAPIEQRWSRSSSSLMAPSHSDNPNGLHSWVGVIMYLPLEDDEKRTKITNVFLGPYCDLVKALSMKYGAVAHWAKLEAPKNKLEELFLRAMMKDKYPVEKFNALRAKFDPHSILTNPLIHTLFDDYQDKKNQN